METQYLTEEGRTRLLAELEYLRAVKRHEIARDIHEAKEAGDITDNAAFEAAKNEQALIEGRIMMLEKLLSRAQQIPTRADGVISLGSRIHLRNSDGREYHYTLVGAFEANPSAGRISNESPVGKALLDHKAGDTVIVATPSGSKTYTILAVE
jgi:transcription elongation factor GreA